MARHAPGLTLYTMSRFLLDVCIALSLKESSILVREFFLCKASRTRQERHKETNGDFLLFYVSSDVSAASRGREESFSQSFANSESGSNFASSVECSMLRVLPSFLKPLRPTFSHLVLRLASSGGVCLLLGRRFALYSRTIRRRWSW